MRARKSKHGLTEKSARSHENGKLPTLLDRFLPRQRKWPQTFIIIVAFILKMPSSDDRPRPVRVGRRPSGQATRTRAANDHREVSLNSPLALADELGRLREGEKGMEAGASEAQTKPLL